MRFLCGSIIKQYGDRSDGRTDRKLTHHYEVDCRFQRGVKALLPPAQPVYFLTNRLRCISTCCAIHSRVPFVGKIWQKHRLVGRKFFYTLTNSEKNISMSQWTSRDCGQQKLKKKHPKVLILSRFVPATFTVGHPSCSGNHSVQIIYTVCRGAIIEMRWSNGPR